MFQKKKAFGKFTPGKVMGAPKLGIHVIGKALTDNVLTQGIGKVAHSLDTQSKRLTQKLKITDSRGAVEGKTFFMRKVKQVHTQTTLEDQQDKPETVQALLETALQQSSFLFRDMDDFQRQDLIAAFEKVEIKKQQVIPEDYFYILYKGQIEMVDGDGETTIRSSQENEDEDGILVSFGEHAMYQQSMEFTHNDVVHARSDCVLYRLHPTHFYTIMEQEKIADSETLALFKTIPVLKDLDRNTLQQLLNAMTPCKFKKGEIIFTKGDQVKTFLIFTKGKAQGTDIEVGGSVYQDISVGPNEEIKSLGWHSILQNEPVLGNVKALTNCKALAIDAQEFQQLMGNYQDLIQRSIDIKRLDNIAIFKDSHLEQDQIVGLLDVMTTKTFMWGGNFWKEGDSIDAALCFVKKGSVTIKSKSAQTSKTIEVGGYFGDDLLLADQNKTVAENTRALTESKYTVQVSRDCVLSILALEDCRKIVNTSLLGLGKSTKICALDQTIQVKDLKRHVMLGAGSFGQVWLASTGADSKKQNKRIFALKVQSKHQLIESHQAEGVVGERNIMASLKSPFIIRLYSTFQDQARVYMLTSLLQGGELEAVIGDGLDEPTSKFYAAGILEGLTYMHRKHIIHRDLKPENVLIGANGYPVLIDLGFAKYVPEKTFTFCGTPMYIAPEVINWKGHNKGADHWSWACLVYEMVTGHYPFYKNDMNQMELFKKISRGEFKLMGYMSYEVKLLLISLFITDPSRRMGSRASGWQEIFDTAWFADVDFKALRRQTIQAPWVPSLKNPLDSSNFSDCSGLEDKMQVKEPTLSNSQQQIFKTFGPVTNDLAAL